MLLPIYAYGQPVLKKMAEDITQEHPGLQEFIENMWETMYHAEGVGLAAPQVGQSIRLFVVDTIQIMEEGKEDEGIRQVFINAHKVEEAGEPWTYEEGCLSIPDVRGDVDRPPQLRLRYVDENFEAHEKVFTGVNARVIQHEYDHIDGILFTEHLKPIKRRLVRRKLEDIRKGKVKVEYKMKFPVAR
ncbi:MAG: peptide deformylase [Phaeodactylibacter sp.]|nr:peptide deformylase [Phaeodactylibacter sp.]MCB9297134.1 peptide deformylase [Lewinellaceae bacterium]